MAYKILVVDDEAHYADMLRDLLLQNNFIADMAVSVRQALDLLDTEEYALIIADYKMPGMDGAEFLQRVRMRSPEIPFFMVSGLMNTHELIRVANLGATLVFEKPLEITGFIRDIRKFVDPLSDEVFRQRFRGDVSGENYPSELLWLSERSVAGKSFVRKLWQSFRRERLAVIRANAGAELEYVSKELSHWKGRTNVQFYTLSPEDFANPDCADALNDALRDPGVSPVVILQGMESATSEQCAALADFFRGGHFALRLHSEIFFLVVLEGDAWDARFAAVHPGLHRLLRGRVITLPPLAERPADVAYYARRLLGSYSKIAGDAAKAQLTPEAVGLLLQHPWRGEFDELSVKLEQVVTLDRSCPLRAADFASVLVGEDVEPSGGYTLRRRLLLAQGRLLDEALSATGGDVSRAYARLGIANRNSLPGENELLYPELLP